MRLITILLYSLLFTNSVHALQYCNNFDASLGDIAVFSYDYGNQSIDINTYTLKYEDLYCLGTTGSYYYKITNCVDGINSSTGHPETTCDRVRYELQYRGQYTCPFPQVADTTTGICEVPPVPECVENEVLNVEANTCDCVEKFVKVNDICVSDIDGDGEPDTIDSDIDGDGILNDSDPDIDGDGIPNDADSTPSGPDSATPIVGGNCQGGNVSIKTYTPTTPIYSNYDYYSSRQTINDCVAILNDAFNVVDADSVYYVPDYDDSCERIYCFVHTNKKNSCTYSASDRKPAGYVYLSNLNEDECIAKVDGTNYTSSLYDFPNSISCPGTAYCFLKPAKDLPPNSNTENNDTSMLSQDLNTTSQDNQALLQAFNTANKHLQDLKDKVDLINKSLEDIDETNNKILASSKDVNNNLSTIDKTLSNSFSKLNSMDSSLKDIDKSIKLTNNGLKGLNGTALKNNSQLNNIASNVRAINDNSITTIDKVTEVVDAMYAEVGLNSDGTLKDGSESFSGFETTAKNSFNGFVKTDLFGLSGLSGGSIPEFSVNMLGRKITVFEPSMLNSFPITEIKALILFFFALMGFVHTFRSI